MTRTVPEQIQIFEMTINSAQAVSVRLRSGQHWLAKFFHVAGRCLCVRTRDARALRLFELNLRHYALAPATQPPIEADCTLTIIDDERPPEIPPGLMVSAAEDCAYASDGQTDYFAVGDAMIVIGHHDATSVTVWTGQRAHARSAPELSNVLTCAVHAALRRAHLFELHAGAVSEPRSGAGVLFIGASGSGKTTMTLRLAAQGWPYLSDDRLALSENENDIRAWPLRREFYVTQNSLAACQMTALMRSTRQHSHSEIPKWIITPQQLFPGRFVSHCQPQALFFPHLTGEKSTRLRALSQSQAMMQLLHHCPWACRDRTMAAAQIRLLQRLATQCRSFRLEAGTDLLEQADLTARLIQSQFSNPEQPR